MLQIFPHLSLKLYIFLAKLMSNTIISYEFTNILVFSLLGFILIDADHLANLKLNY